MKAFKCDVCGKYFSGDPEGTAVFSIKYNPPFNYDMCRACLSYLHRVIRDGANNDSL